MINKDIYGRIYEITAQNMSKNGKEMGFGKEMFTTFAGAKSRQLDIHEILQIDRGEFVQAVFLLGLDRYPEDEVINAFGKLTDYSDLQFKYAVIDTVVPSEEFNMFSGSIVCNDFAYMPVEELIYTEPEKSDNNGFFGRLFLGRH